MLNRETGEPIWPIEERPVPQSEVPSEKTSPTQPFPTKPKPFDRQGFSLDDVIDFTPQLHSEGLEIVKRYRIGPLFTPPALERPDGPPATLMLPADVGGANWPGGALDPETNRLYIHSHTAVYPLPNTAADLASIEPGTPTPGGGGAWRGRSWCGGPRRRVTLAKERHRLLAARSPVAVGHLVAAGRSRPVLVAARPAQAVRVAAPGGQAVLVAAAARPSRACRW